MAGQRRKTPPSSPSAHSKSSKLKKHNEAALSCVKCGLHIHNSSCISCASCSLWTHAKKACSNLSTADAKRDIITKDFQCSRCAPPTEPVIDSLPMDTGDDTVASLRPVLIAIHRELSECKKQMSQLHEDNQALKHENAEIKSVLKKLQKSQSAELAAPSHAPVPPSFQPAPRPSRDRSNSRRHLRSVSRESRARNPSILKLNQNIRMSGGDKAFSKTNRLAPGRARPSNGRVVDQPYSSEETKAKLLRALPVASVKYCSRYVFLTLYHCTTSAADVLKHLKSFKFDVSCVHRIKTKTRTDNYRSFAIRCSDLDYDAILEDSSLWHPGSIIDDMKSEPREDQIIETAKTGA